MLTKLMLTLLLLTPLAIATTPPPPPPSSTPQTRQQHCLKVAADSGQNVRSPIGVRRVCGLDVVLPTINPSSIPLAGPTGVVGEPGR